jgi:hypothetical protein
MLITDRFKDGYLDTRSASWTDHDHGLEGYGLIKRQPTAAWKRTLAERALRGRSGLFNWIRANFAELSATRAELKSTWEDLAAAAGSEGLTDAAGHPPSAEAVRKAWLRVEQAIAARPGQTAPAPESTPAPPPTPAGEGGTANRTGLGEQKPRNTFTVARLKRPPEEQQ